MTVSTQAPPRRRFGGGFKLKLFAYALVAPVVLLILGLVAYPFLFAIWVSFTDMVGVAESFAKQLGGQLVDDNRKPLTEAGIASIRRTLDKVVAAMESHGVPAGSSLARRLFS